MISLIIILFFTSLLPSKIEGVIVKVVIVLFPVVYGIEVASKPFFCFFFPSFFYTLLCSLTIELKSMTIDQCYRIGLFIVFYFCIKYVTSKYNQSASVCYKSLEV